MSHKASTTPTAGQTNLRETELPSMTTPKLPNNLHSTPIHRGLSNFRGAQQENAHAHALAKRVLPVFSSNCIIHFVKRSQLRAQRWHLGPTETSCCVHSNAFTMNARLIFMDTGRLLINIIKFLLYREHLKHLIPQLQLTTDGCCRGANYSHYSLPGWEIIKRIRLRRYFHFHFTHSRLLITYRNSDGARTPASVPHSVKLTSSHRVSGLSGLCNVTPKVGENSYLVWPAGTSGRLTVSRQNLSSFSF